MLEAGRRFVMPRPIVHKRAQRACAIPTPTAAKISSRERLIVHLTLPLKQAIAHVTFR